MPHASIVCSKNPRIRLQDYLDSFHDWLAPLGIGPIFGCQDSLFVRRPLVISLGTLNANGCKISAEGGALKVNKGALVVMKARKAGSMYVLHGSTVTDSAAVSSSPMTDSDVTKLWHMRLRHMSEKGLTLLRKKGLLCGQSTVSR